MKLTFNREFILFIITVVFFTSCKKEIPEKLKSVAITFIRTYEGTIQNKYEYVVKLTANNGKIKGKYLYKNKGTEINLAGTIDESGNLELEELSDKGVKNGLFIGTVEGNKIEGTWSKPGQDKDYPFVFIETTSQYDIMQVKAQGVFAQKQQEIREAKMMTTEDLVGDWNVKLNCTNSDCKNRSVGDMRTEKWTISFDNGEYLITTPNRVYKGEGYFNGETLNVESEQIEFLGFSSRYLKAKYNMELSVVNKRSMKGKRTVIDQAPCKIEYSLEAKKD